MLIINASFNMKLLFIEKHKCFVSLFYNLDSINKRNS